jgi:coenzyme F420-dependent oxidoreductase
MLATGVTFGSSADRDGLLEYGQLAETAGLESVWIGESWGESAVPTLTQLLGRTDSIHACSGIFNVYARTPAMVAMTAAALADVGDGRFRLGLGVSGPAVIENFHGVPFEAPLRRTREYVEIVRAFLAGERVDYDGDLFDLSGFALDADPRESPIYLAAIGETNRQLAGEFADGWMPLFIPHTAFGDALAAVRRGADRGDRSLDAVDVAPWIPTCVSASDPEAARRAVRSLIAFYVGAMGDYYADAAADFGFPDAVEAIREGWADDRLDGARAAVPDRVLSAFGAAGTPAEAAETFRAYADAGADSPVAYVPARQASDALIRETIDHL